jgi:hypothetical protein
MSTLVMVHGRAQEHKDPDTLKEEWISSLALGLATNGLEIPVERRGIRFPYYGQALFDLVQNTPQAAEVVVRGEAPPDPEATFLGEVIEEILASRSISDMQLREIEGHDHVARGVLNWAWVRTGMTALDRFVPGASASGIALATRDVYQYLHVPGIRDEIERGVRQAFNDEDDMVLVTHSLGTVVTYNLLRREGRAQGWRVPLLVTLGSPLGVTAIRRALRPLQELGVVDRWFNAFDPRDIVALYPLDESHFPVRSEIENYGSVSNETPNRHGIRGYLSDPEVAVRIYGALRE